MLNLFRLKSGNRLDRKDTFFQFSTEEQFTGEYWIDGKKIYTKTIVFSSVSLNQNIVVDTINNFAELVCIHGSAFDDMNWHPLPKVARTDNQGWQAQLAVTPSGEVKVGTGIGCQFSKGYVIVVYTKTS